MRQWLLYVATSPYTHVAAVMDLKGFHWALVGPRPPFISPVQTRSNRFLGGICSVLQWSIDHYSSSKQMNRCEDTLRASSGAINAQPVIILLRYICDALR